MQHTRKGTRCLAMMRVVCELENTVSAKEHVSGQFTNPCKIN
jgi:hypothetical protein